jgi:ABC-2 type transport system permease protein
VSLLGRVFRAWWFQLKMRSRSAFDGSLGIVYPIFFATTVFLIYRQGGDTASLAAVAVGASVMGVWSAVSTTASSLLQRERRDGTLELLVAAPTPFSLVILPSTLSMATIGLYSMVATLVFGRVAFGIEISFAHPFVFVLAALVAALSIGVIGFLQAVASVRYRSAWAVGWALELPVWLVCGFVVPVTSLPGWVRPISWLLPPTWGVEAVRSAALGGSPMTAIGLCLLTTAVYASIGALLTTRVVDSARIRASLALT